MNMDNNISFGARFVQKIPIKKYSFEDKIYKQATANLVELDPFDIKDVHTLGNIADEFGGDSFANNVYIDAKSAYKRNNRATTDMRIFALTKQEDTFDKLKDREILGIVETSNKAEKSIEIEYLQTHPKFIYPWGPAAIKRIGSAILDCLKSFNDKITLRSSPNATFFYKKNGFEKVDPNKRIFVWNKEN